MLKARNLEILYLLFSVSVVLVVTAFGLFGDILFFKSDIASAFMVVFVISSVVFSFAVAAYLALVFFNPSSQHSGSKYVGQLFTSLIIANCGYFLLNAVDVKFGATWRAKRLLSPYFSAYPEFLWLLFWCVGLAFVWHKISISQQREVFLHRGKTLAFVGTAVSLLVFVLLSGHKILGERNVQADDRAPRHLVLVILDGWPSRYGKVFSPSAATSTTNDVINEGVLFRNVRTNCVWTSCYFGTLYLGSPKFAFSHGLDLWIGGARSRVWATLRLRLWNEAFDSRENLIALLQRQGVKVRTFHFHRNGIPEGSAAKLSNYSGFRSVFLSSLNTWILDVLGLEYSMQFTGPTRNTLEEDARRYIVARLLPSPPTIDTYSNVLTDMLLPEMRRIRDGGRKSFIIFHVDWPLGGAKIPQAFDENPSAGAVDDVVKKARRIDYRYAAEDEWYAARLRQVYEMSSKDVEAKIAAFIQQLGSLGLLNNTIVMFTADHGSMSTDGRLWYGFHPDEDVSRVPMLVFGVGRSGVDERNFETIDVTQTILDYFGATRGLHARAKSLLKRETKPFTATVTQPSDVNNQWYIVIYKNDRKYVFNIHPRGDGKAVEQRISGYDTITVRQDLDVIRTVLPEFIETLVDFNFDEIGESAIHLNYSKVRLMELAKTRNLE
jgi:Sulfatase